MLRRLLPRQEDFFSLFQQMANLLVKAAGEFTQLLQDLEQPQKYVDHIVQHEKAADQIAHVIFEKLHKTFITPFDRHDIHRLTSGLDDVLDQINRCAQRFPYYELTTVPEEIIELANLCLEGGKIVQTAIAKLDALKKADEIFAQCSQIDKLESKAHQLVLAGEKTLFLHENEFKQFFKLKDIYARIKLVIDALEDVGNIMKGIVLEYS